MTRELVGFLKKNLSKYPDSIRGLDPGEQDKLFTLITDFTFIQLRERFTHPYQYAEEVHRLLLFMELNEKGRARLFSSPENIESLVEAALGIEKCVLFSQLTQNFGIRRKTAAELVSETLPLILQGLVNQLEGENSLPQLLQALGKENKRLFLNVEMLVSILFRRRTGAGFQNQPDRRRNVF